jgi:transposase
MTAALSSDIRIRVIRAVEGGLSRRAAAERFNVSVSSAVRWVQRWREAGTHEPQAQGGDKRSHRIEAYGDELLAAIAEKPDLTLVEIAELLEKTHALRVAPSTVWRFLDRRAVTFKKNGARRGAGAT